MTRGRGAMDRNDGTSNAQVNGNVHMGMEGPRELGRINRHTEFILSVEWCLFGAEGRYVWLLL